MKYVIGKLYKSVGGHELDCPGSMPPGSIGMLLKAEEISETKINNNLGPWIEFEFLVGDKIKRFKEPMGWVKRWLVGPY